MAVDVSIPKKAEQNDVAWCSFRTATILATLHPSMAFLRAAGEAATSGRPNASTLAICILASVVGKSPSLLSKRTGVVGLAGELLEGHCDGHGCHIKCRAWSPSSPLSLSSSWHLLFLRNCRGQAPKLSFNFTLGCRLSRAYQPLQIQGAKTYLAGNWNGGAATHGTIESHLTGAVRLEMIASVWASTVRVFDNCAVSDTSNLQLWWAYRGWSCECGNRPQNCTNLVGFSRVGGESSSMRPTR